MKLKLTIIIVLLFSITHIGSNTMEIYQAQMSGTTISPSSLWPEIPPELEALILRCVQCAPDARFVSAGDLGVALSRLRS